MKKRVVWGVVLFLPVVLGLGALLMYLTGVVLLERAGLLGAPYVVAEYGNMSFRGRTTKELWLFWAGGTTSGPPTCPVAPIYVMIRDEGPFFLPELPEEVAAKLYVDRDDGWANRTDVMYSTRGSGFLLYRDGKLIEVSFTDTSEIRLGPSRNGPFLKLPANRKQVERVFGPPLRWERGRSAVQWY